MIRVLVVDDQAVVAGAHRVFIDRVPGFRTVGVVHDGEAALARVDRGDVDLLLLDLTMPGLSGLDVCRALRTRPDAPDVIVVTAVRDLESVRTAVQLGAVHYLIKPFTFAMLRSKLDHYATYRAAAAGCRDVTDQSEIDLVLATLREPSDTGLAKGMSRETLNAVRAALVAMPDGLTAAHAAELVGASRVTVRRYLDNLVNSGACDREPVYGGAGRPKLLYRLRPSP